MLVEQAIFTSAQTDRAQGYQLVGRSRGLSEADARELAVWGPSHDSLLREHEQRTSTNFFRLASGAYAVSRTTLAGAEYSGRGGEVVHTQFLVVPPEVLLRFANNPFAVLRAATALGAMEVQNHVSETLEAVRLGGRASSVDLTLLAQLSRDPGPRAIATFVQAALSSDRLAIAAETSCDRLIAGLFSILPLECRTDFSFSTALKYSPSRPVRISALPEDQSTWRAIARAGFTLLTVQRTELADELCWEGWAGCVAQVLSAGKLSLLATELEQPRPWLNSGNLYVLADQVAANLHGPTRRSVAAAAAPSGEPPASEDHAVQPAQSVATHQRADGAHLRREAILTATDTCESKRSVEELAEVLAAQPPEVLELLERIDDLVFAAIAGDNQALTELEVFWPTAVAELDEDLVDHSREQYLRCALSICSEAVDSDLKRPERAAAIIDVLCVLFGE